MATQESRFAAWRYAIRRGKSTPSECKDCGMILHRDAEEPPWFALPQCTICYCMERALAAEMESH